MRKAIQFIKKYTGIQLLLNKKRFKSAVEDCEWLRNKSFRPGFWAMDNAALYTLLHILDNVRPKNILEFGLGQSSKTIHQYAEFMENVSALTIEHNNDWIDTFCNGDARGVKINVKQYDKAVVRVNGVETLSYKNMADIIEGGKYDFIVVDGPFGSRHYSRSQIIDMVKGGLPERFCIFVDDTERGGERETFEAVRQILEGKKIHYWIQEYDGEKNRHTVLCSKDIKISASSGQKSQNL
jgi:hypothetical protein